MGIPAVTGSGFARWSRPMPRTSWYGCEAAPRRTKAEARSFECEQLERKLASDTHAGEVARTAFDRIEAEIDGKRVELEVLDGRHRDFVLDAVIEAADAVGAEYTRQAAELQVTLERLLGLASILGSRAGFRSAYLKSEADIALPVFGQASVPGGIKPATMRAGQLDRGPAS